ncbi:MAG: hypothetical protein Q8O72_01280 [Bacteroidales bacterium]|nr:hypothetical protein [Bacteroidales bacterium]
MKQLIAIFLVLIMAVACNEKKTPGPGIVLFLDNVFILNQGNFTYANSSLSTYDPVTKTVEQSVFYRANGVPLGDVAQSMTINGDTAYVVVNNSGFIYAINRKTFQFISKITGFESPRNMLFVNKHKAYVSDLYAKYITVIYPLTNEVIKHIPLGRSSESMVMAEGKVFVANWSNYNQTAENNMIMVIDPETDQLIDSIQVGKEPNSMVVDKYGYLWVLCSGGYMNEEVATLWKVDPVSLTGDKKFEFEQITDNPTSLCLDQENNLYYLNHGVFRMDISLLELPKTAFIPEDDRNFYALFIYLENQIYVSDAGNYLSNGWVYVYNSSGDETDHFEVGIIPGYFVLNR